LGLTQDNPAVDCRDILENGPGKEIGEFWVQPSPQSQVIKVICDNITDGGGWTLMSNYFYQKNDSMSMEKKEDQIPTKLVNADSHFFPKKKMFTKK